MNTTLDFTTLKKNLKKDFSDLPKIKVALLGNTSTQFLSQALRGAGYEKGLDLNIWEADFDQIQLQVFDDQSELYQNTPDVIVIFQSSHKLLLKYSKFSYDLTDFADSELMEIEKIFSAIRKNASSKIIYYNYAEIDDAVFGNFANSVEASFLFQIRKLNCELMKLASKDSAVYICDISSVQNQVGRAFMFSPSIYVNTESVLSLDVLPLIAFKTISIMEVFKGRLKKCLILDLDNTLWGGVIGDDGIENIQLGTLGIGKAFTEFQLWIKKLKNRGIILAVCSKNDEAVAKQPFLNHPDMVLKVEDIAVFVANWENKVDNIIHIQSILNIGFDSIVFLDDNPFERNMVRSGIPDIVVPELPEDPALYLDFLYSQNLFETISVSKEDEERTKLYQTEALRNSAQKKFENEDDFLKSMQMQCLVEPVTKFNAPRIAQLSQRSNQFNLRTVRYTESELEQASRSGLMFNFAFTLKDKFGDNGLICVVMLKQTDKRTLFIENWFMSCRVLKRRMEEFTLNTIVDFAKEHNYITIKGEYIKTVKNSMVSDHYSKLGFTWQDNSWELAVDEYKRKECFIDKIDVWNEARY